MRSKGTHPAAAAPSTELIHMRSVICVHERFDAIWPFAADYWHERWRQTHGCELYRTREPEARAPQIVPEPASVHRLVLLGLPAESEDLAPFSALEECFHGAQRTVPAGGIAEAAARGVSFIPHREDIYWGQSVAEFALGLTICALRRIPQTYAAMMRSHEPWDYHPQTGRPGRRGAQFGDDIRFTNGTIAGKRVRIVGAGNIGGRYASFCAAMGAEDFLVADSNAEAVAWIDRWPDWPAPALTVWGPAGVGQDASRTCLARKERRRDRPAGGAGGSQSR